jgi:hypothetical protein
MSASSTTIPSIMVKAIAMKPTMMATEPRLSERHRWIAERIRGSEKFCLMLIGLVL